MSNEILVAGFVVAALVVIYLLRHVIALAVRLIVLAALVLGGYWAWQHRGELLDTVAPYLGGDRGGGLGDMDAPVLRDLLDVLDSSQEPDAPAGGGGATTILQELEQLVAPEEDAPAGGGGATAILQELEQLVAPEEPEDPAEPGRPPDPTAPE